MDLKILLMPILSFLAGMFALFTDTRDKKAKKLLILCLITILSSICISEVYFKYNENLINNEEKNWLKKRIEQLSQALAKFESVTGDNFVKLFDLLEKETEKITKEEIQAPLRIKKKENAYVYYGIRNNNGKWTSRFFKNISKRDDALPEVGDTVEAISNVNVRAGYINYVVGSGWMNKKIIGAVKPKNKLKVLEVNAILGNFIWIKFEAI